MKKNFTKILAPSIFLFLIVIGKQLVAQPYDFQDVALQSRWDDTTLTADNWVNSRYSGCWGWANPVDNKEYAIIGSNDGTHIIEITDPANPELRAYVPGLQVNCVWREYKTYQHYLYMVSDDNTPNGMQIADLSYLPDSVHIVYSGSSIFSRCHTIWVDGDKLYGGSVTGGVVGSYASMAVFSLANPELPALLRTLNADYPAISTVHDMFVRNDTVYASCGYAGLFIYKFNANNTFTLLSNLTSYPDQGYNHSSSLTADGQTLIFMDEVPSQLAVKVLNVSDISNPVVTTTFKSSLGDTPHNPFVMGNDYVVCANYQDGIQIYNISDPANPVKTGFFDTHYQTPVNNVSNGYVGCWGAYPYFPSGNLIAADMQNGLFILNPAAALGVHQNPAITQSSATAFYNAANNSFDLSVKSSANQKMNIEVVDILGQKVFATENSFKKDIATPLSISCSGLAKGVYTIRISGEEFSFTRKVFKSL